MRTPVVSTPKRENSHAYVSKAPEPENLDFANLTLDQDPFDAADDESLRAPPPGGPTKSASGLVAYVVFTGRKTGIFQTWESANAQLKGYPGNCFKGYKTLEEAEQAWAHACTNQTINTPLSTPSRPADARPPRVPRGPLKSEEVWYVVVQGAFPGVYQGKTAAKIGLGETKGRVMKFATEGDANDQFVKLWMAGQIILL